MKKLTLTALTCCKSTDAVDDGNGDGNDDGVDRGLPVESAAKTTKTGTTPSPPAVVGASGGTGGPSVYYDALQSEHRRQSAVSFNPLILKSGVSLDVPESVLRAAQEMDAIQEGDDDEEGAAAAPQAAAEAAPAAAAAAAVPSPPPRKKSLRNTLTFQKGLEETPPVVDTPHGYPGHLTKSQLDSCLTFRKRLKDGATGHTAQDQVYRDMVSALSDVEEEPYAVCRYMRARNFNVDETFRMMEEQSVLWKQGATHNFYPTASDALGGAPESAFLTQFPLVVGPIARNGCVVVYFNVRHLKIEGIECVASLESIPAYFWHLALHKFKHHIAAQLAENPARFVRAQLMVVVDLQSLGLSTLRSAMDALKGALTVWSVFPEFLFNFVILNVPGFFGTFWPLIKKFMDGDTAQKFELYTDAHQGRTRLLELLGEDELASDFGGKGRPSTELEVARQGGGGAAGVDRQFAELLVVHKRKEGVCTFELKEGETATLAVYTKAAQDGAATVSLQHDGKSVAPIVTMTRPNEKKASGAYHMEIGSAPLNGPGTYRVGIKRQQGQGSSHAEHFLVLANIMCRRPS